MFSLLTEVVAIPQVSLECNQLLGRVYTSLFLASSETQAWQLVVSGETFPPLSTSLCLRGWSPCGKRERERERKESFSVVHAERYHYTTPYSNVFFVCVWPEKVIFCFVGRLWQD